MKENKLGEHGLTGTHGFIAPGVHVCANYAANEGNVFISVQDDGFGLTWRRVPKVEAKESDIIRCFCCSEPAVTVGPFYPLYDSDNACAEHSKLTSGEREEIAIRKNHPKPEITLDQFSAMTDDEVDEMIATEALLLYRMGDSGIWWAGCDG